MNPVASVSAPPIPRLVAPSASAKPDAAASSAAVPTAGHGQEGGAPTVRLLNPDPVIDPALGIVVTEYFNTQGALTSQYPTQRMLNAYSVNGLPGLQAHPAPPETGAPETGAPETRAG